jgi:hypothetical protein
MMIRPIWLEFLDRNLNVGTLSEFLNQSTLLLSS